MVIDHDCAIFAGNDCFEGCPQSTLHAEVDAILLRYRRGRVGAQHKCHTPAPKQGPRVLNHSYRLRTPLYNVGREVIVSVKQYPPYPQEYGD